MNPEIVRSSELSRGGFFQFVWLLARVSVKPACTRVRSSELSRVTCGIRVQGVI
jgi:hypothetical protein